MTRYAVKLNYDTLYIHVDLTIDSDNISYENAVGDIVPTQYQPADADYDIKEAVYLVICELGPEYWCAPSDEAELTKRDGSWNCKKVRKYIMDAVESADITEE